MMVVVAHPGDEAFGFGGAIATAVAEGAYVVVVCVTRGWYDSRLAEKSPAPGGKTANGGLRRGRQRRLVACAAARPQVSQTALSPVI